MAEQPGTADSQAEEVVQQIARLAQGDAEVGATIASEQSRPRSDMGAGQFQVATTLTGSLAGAATMDVPTITMPLQLGLGDVGDDVVLELSGRFEILAATMLALLRMNVVLDELRIGRRLGPKDARMLAMFLAPPIVGRSLPQLTSVLGTFAALQKCLQLMFELRDPLPQLGILCLEFRNPSIPRVIHDPHSLPKLPISGKSSCLTVTLCESRSSDCELQHDPVEAE
jgi:hypothetical protein